MAFARRIRSGQVAGVCIAGSGTKGRMEGCDISEASTCVEISDGADPILTDCKCASPPFGWISAPLCLKNQGGGEGGGALQQRGITLVGAYSGRP